MKWKKSLGGIYNLFLLSIQLFVSDLTVRESTDESALDLKHRSKRSSSNLQDRSWVLKTFGSEKSCWFENFYEQ